MSILNSNAQFISIQTVHGIHFPAGHLGTADPEKVRRDFSDGANRSHGEAGGDSMNKIDMQPRDSQE